MFNVTYGYVQLLTACRKPSGWYLVAVTSKSPADCDREVSWFVPWVDKTWSVLPTTKQGILNRPAMKRDVTTIIQSSIGCYAA